MRDGSLVKDHNGIPLGAQVCVRVPRGMRKRCKFMLERKPVQLSSVVSNDLSKLLA